MNKPRNSLSGQNGGSLPERAGSSPASSTHITENFGHPWTRAEGWDLLEIIEDSEEKLDAQIAAWENKMWKIWIRDDTGKIAAVMYKPRGAISKDWKDPIDEK